MCFSYFLTLKRRKQTSISKVSMIFILNDVHQYCRENWASLQLLFWFSKVRKVSDIKRNEKLSGARFLTILKREVTPTNTYYNHFTNSLQNVCRSFLCRNEQKTSLKQVEILIFVPRLNLFLISRSHRNYLLFVIIIVIFLPS